MAMTIAAHFGEPAEVYVLGDRILSIPAMTYEEAAVFCSGAEGAFAPAALLPMMKANLPILVKDISDPSCLTVISGSKPASEHVVTGFVVEDGFALINVRGTGLVGKVGVSSSIFGALARGGVNIRFISQPSSEFCITVAISSKDLPAAREALSGLYKDGQVSLDDAVDFVEDVCLLSVCGNGMKNVPGTSGRIYTALGAYGVNIISAAQGGDELTISFVIRAADRAAAEHRRQEQVLPGEHERAGLGVHAHDARQRERGHQREGHHHRPAQVIQQGVHALLVPDGVNLQKIIQGQHLQVHTQFFTNNIIT
jgi:aspartokinase/homoserine dehydrogenase 1